MIAWSFTIRILRGNYVTDPLPPADELAAIRAEAVRIAAEAGALLLDYFRRPLDIRFKSKDDRDPVSEADEAAERLLREAILARFPDHAVLGEETETVSGNAEIIRLEVPVAHFWDDIIHT